MTESLIEVLLYVGGFIIFIIAGIASLAIQRKLEKQMDENYFVVRKPLLTLIGAFLLTFVCAVIASILINSDGNRWAGIVFYFVAFAGLSIIVNHLRWKVTVNDQEISFRSFFGRSFKTFMIGTITRAVSLPEQYIGKKVTLHSEDGELLSINTWSRGWSFFEARLRQEGIEIVSGSPATKDPGPKEVSKMQRKVKKISMWIIGICVALIVLVLFITRT